MFTARYGLSPYITQVRFVFIGLHPSFLLTSTHATFLTFLILLGLVYLLVIPTEIWFLWTFLIAVTSWDFVVKVSLPTDAQNNCFKRTLIFTLKLCRKSNKMQLCNRIYYSKTILKAQHVSSGTPLIIRSTKIYLQPLVYMPIWWPAVAKVECPLSLGNRRSPYGHINQRLQIQFRAHDYERCTARNMLSL